tara:strand:+ start:256 stop:546 length:291 start_codon:yes stop_codon:yes gene_type:complete
MSLNNRIYKNNVEWNDETTLTRVATAAGAIKIAVEGSYLILSNNSGISVFVGSDAAVDGVLVEPGGSFETAVAPDANIQLRAAAVVAAGIGLLWFN